MRASFLIIVLALAGCASPRTTEKSVEQNAYERGYGQAVKEQYWIIQNQQREKSEPAEEKP